MFNKLVRIGRDAEMKYLPSGAALMAFPAVYDVGFGDKKKGQWIDCVMFGDRAEKLNEHFTKGKQIVIYADDVCIQEWDKTDGSGKGFKLSCKLVNFDFVSNGQQAPAQQQAPQQQSPQRQAPAQQSQYAQQPQQTPSAPPSMDSFDDDLPDFD